MVFGPVGKGIDEFSPAALVNKKHLSQYNIHDVLNMPTCANEVVDSNRTHFNSQIYLYQHVF